MVADITNLHRREIIDILIGDQKITTNDNIEVYMRYLRASDITALFKRFDIAPEYRNGASRWEIMETLLIGSIEHKCYNEVLTHLFSIIDCSKSTLTDKKSAVECFVDGIIDHINTQFVRNGIALERGEYSTIYLVFTESPLISVNMERTIDIEYVRRLANECEQDFHSENVDSIMTKTRTMLEEVFISVLESKNDLNEEPRGRIRDLFEDVRKSCNLDDPKSPKEVRAIVSSLAAIVENVGNVRNNYSNSHGVGAKRSSLTLNEAKLVLNSAITLMEYVLSVSKEKTTDHTA